MSIRTLQLADLPLLAEGGSSFFAEGKIPGKFDAAHFEKSWASYLQGGFGVVFGMFNDESGKIEGALGAILYPSPFDGALMAVEQFWFVFPEARGNGLRLLRAFETWAIANGARHACMVHLLSLQPQTLGKLYERRGYRPIEVNYIKDLELCVANN